MILRFEIEVAAVDEEDAEEQLSSAQASFFALVREEQPRAEFECVHEFIGRKDRRGRPISDVFGRRTFRVHTNGYNALQAVEVYLSMERRR